MLLSNDIEYARSAVIWSGEMDRFSLRSGQVQCQPGSDNVLQANTGSIENRYLAVVRPARRSPGYDVSNRRYARPINEPRLEAMLTLSDVDRLIDIVGKNTRACQERFLDFMLTLGVRTHAGKVGTAADEFRVEKWRKRRGNGDDDV